MDFAAFSAEMRGMQVQRIGNRRAGCSLYQPSLGIEPALAELFDAPYGLEFRPPGPCPDVKSGDMKSVCENRAGGEMLGSWNVKSGAEPFVQDPAIRNVRKYHRQMDDAH